MKCSRMLWIVQHKDLKCTVQIGYVSKLKLCAWLFSWLFAWLVGCELPNVDTLPFFQDIARYIKEEFNKKYDRYWHCIVGPNFVCSVNDDSESYINFDMSEDEIVLFKMG